MLIHALLGMLKGGPIWREDSTKIHNIPVLGQMRLGRLPPIFPFRFQLHIIFQNQECINLLVLRKELPPEG